MQLVHSAASGPLTQEACWQECLARGWHWTDSPCHRRLPRGGESLGMWAPWLSSVWLRPFQVGQPGTWTPACLEASQAGRDHKALACRSMCVPSELQFSNATALHRDRQRFRGLKTLTTPMWDGESEVGAPRPLSAVSLLPSELPAGRGL